MAKYMILIYEQEAPYAAMDAAGEQQVMEAHMRFYGQVGELGGRHRHRAPQASPGCGRNA